MQAEIKAGHPDLSRNPLLAGLNRRRFLGGLGAIGAAAFLPGRALAGETADVLIVGAGLSGLNAAMILASEGMKVLVVEADSRPGGRVRTLDDAPGRPEAGGAEVGPLYARTRHLVDELGLSLVPRPIVPGGMTIHSDGRLIHPRDWATDSANPLPAALRAVPPQSIESAIMAKASLLSDAEAWLSPEAAARDGAYDALLRQLGADDAALSFIQPGVGDTLADVSALWMLRRDQIRSQSASVGGVDSLTGGMSRLTDAMAATLGERVRYGVAIRAISQGPGGIVAEDAEGRRYSAARALVTVPLPVLKQMRLDPLPAASAVWDMVPYGEAASFFFPVTAPFWEEDGLPPSLWSDTLPFRTFLVGNDVGQHLWVYAQKPKAALLQGHADDEMKETVRRRLVAARPSLEGRITTGAAWSWTANPLALGTFAGRRPGNLARVQKLLKAPHGRVSFAGEHSADLSSGIEGALESGERAAIELLA